MNRLADMVEKAATAWSHWMLPMAWQVALLALAIIGIAWAARKAPPRFRYLLWCLVLVKLCLPPTFSFVTGIGQWLPASQPVEIVVEPAAMPQYNAPGPVFHAPPPVAMDERSFDPAYTESRPDSVESQPAPAAEPIVAPPAPAYRPSLRAILMAVWAVGVALMALLITAQHVCLARMLSRGRPVDDPEILSMLAEAACSLRVRRAVTLLSVPQLESPILFGLFRPRIAIPCSALAALSRQQLRPVLLHELSHLKRRDLWVNGLQMLLQILYWFHPMVWIAGSRLRAERELIVDDMVIASLHEGRRCYSDSLLAIIRQSAKSHFLTPGYVGIMEPRASISHRLRRILDENRKLSLRIGVASILFIALLGFILIPQARSEKAPEAAEMTNTAAEAPPSAPQPPAFAETTRPPNETTPPSEPTAPLAAAEKPPLRVAGTVLDEQERPVAGARVIALNISPKGPLDPFRPAIDLLTDDEGRFETYAVDGTYYVLAWKGRLTSDGGPWAERRWKVQADRELEHLVLHVHNGGRVTGTVVNKDTGAPISGAGVVSDSLHTTLTGKDGRFEIIGMGLGEHTLKVISPGRSNTHQDINTTDSADYDIRIEMPRGYVVRGRVTDEAGKPVAGASVRDIYSGTIIQCAMQHGLTDADGRYELKSYPFTRDLFGIAVEHDNFASVTKGQLKPPADGDVLTVDFALDQGYAVEGEVYDQEGKPVKEATVSYSANQSYVGYVKTRTDENGRFLLTRISRPREDEIFVQAKGSSPAGQRATPGKGADAPHLTFTLLPGHTATGRVVDPKGNPIEGATLQAIRTADLSRDWNYFGKRVKSDAEGRFTLENLPASGVTADAWKEGYSSVRRTPINVDGETEIRMDASGVIKGRVVDDVTGAPITAFNVRLNIPNVPTGDRPGASFSSSLSGRGQDCRADDGGFTIEDLIARAAHVVIVTAPGYAETRVEEVIAQAADSPDWPTVIKLGKGTMLGGTVTDAKTGQPVAGAEILLIRFSDPLRDVPLNLFENRDRYVYSTDLATSDEAGRFEFRIGDGETRRFSLLARHKEYAPILLKDVPRDAPASIQLDAPGAVLCKTRGVPGVVPDQWRVQLVAGDLNMGNDLVPGNGTVLFNNVPAGPARRIWLWSPKQVETIAYADVTAGTTTEVDLANLPGSSLTGRVTSLGEPLADVSIAVNSTEDGALMGAGRTNADGEYVIKGLPAGRYIVYARRENWDRDVLGKSISASVTVEAQDVRHDFIFQDGKISGRLTGPSGAPYVEGHVHVMRLLEPDAAPEWTLSSYKRGDDEMRLSATNSAYARMHAEGLAETPALGRRREAERSAMSGPDGSFAFAGLAPGEYIVAGEGREDTRETAYTRAALERDGESVNVDLRLEKPDELVLEVRDARTRKPVAGARAFLCMSDGLFLATQRRVENPSPGKAYEPIVSDEQGRIECRELPAGRYGAWIVASGYAAQWVSPVETSAAGQGAPRLVEMQPAGTLFFKLPGDAVEAPAGAYLVYRITDEKGVPVFPGGEALDRGPLESGAVTLVGAKAEGYRLTTLAPARYAVAWEVRPASTGREPKGPLFSGQAAVDLRPDAEAVITLAP
jgi:beta-lactamase regulating signal transducer with metallopeptidase domain